MSSLLSACQRLAFFGLVAAMPFQASAQPAFGEEGSEYPLAMAWPGDQTFPAVSISPNGGYVVWQDNATDSDGLGVSARRLNENLSGVSGAFRVNRQEAGDQDSPQVALLKNGGAAFVWRGGPAAGQHIYARFLGPDGQFISEDDQMVNSYMNGAQLSPALATLSDGNIIIAWSSLGQDGSMQGVFGQRLGPTGEKLGPEFQVNQSTAFNQRTPSVAALPDGKFVVTWVSESGSEATGIFTVNIYARLFPASGSPPAEVRISNQTNVCANPSVIGCPDGTYTIVWGQKEKAVTTVGTTPSPEGDTAFWVQGTGTTNTNSWEIFARSFNSDGTPRPASVRVNTYRAGAQYAPRIAALGNDYLVVWTSMGQDGAME
ncbi:MAG: hypothetical protein HY674_09285, partial [Chloroflexi bacterium]|nr:hypothetical protein [Chloroflexota bacterium]